MLAARYSSRRAATWGRIFSPERDISSRSAGCKARVITISKLSRDLILRHHASTNGRPVIQMSSSVRYSARAKYGVIAVSASV